MSKYFEIVYPPGGGGTWLSATIAQLENPIPSLPSKQKDNTFDNNLRSVSCSVKHYHDFAPEQVEADLGRSNVLMFSVNRPFNHYIQLAYKVLYNPSPNFKTYYLGDMPLIDQFFKLSNSARHLNGEWYSKIYCNKIDLDQGLIFTDSLAFVNQLFNILDYYQLSYTQNKEFCRSCVESYKLSHVMPKTVYDNFDNIVWLGWCHALSLIDNMNIPFKFSNAKSVKELSQELLPFRDKFLYLTENKIFNWY